jgi:hypothetical protein
MPRITPFRLAAACTLALSLLLVGAAGASAKGFLAELRVVGSGGKVLVEKPIAAATTSVKTSPQATCFGAGTGGSGDPVTIKGNTAMGLLASGSKSVAALRPLSISDHFDFGLALCGIGSSIAKGKASWYLKVNHKSLSVGGDAAVIHAGDEVLWDLAPSYPYPGELVLSGPSTAKAGVPFTVRVLSYDEKGKSKPAAGVKVTGASAPTGADGRTTVTLSKPAQLTAKAAGEIPSAREPVCIGGKCPK